MSEYTPLGPPATPVELGPPDFINDLPPGPPDFDAPAVDAPPVDVPPVDVPPVDVPVDDYPF